MSKQKMTPSEALVETMAAEGVKYVFGIVGSAFMDALDLFPDAGIRFIPVAHEQAAAHAADGLARVTGMPQACIAQNGPGAANFVSAITAAYWAHSPVVAIAPETGSMGIGTGGFQELDQMPMFQAQTVYQVRVNRAERMAELGRRAFYMAKNFNGPSHLNIPRDYFYGEVNDEIYRTPLIRRGAGSMEDLEEAAKLALQAKYPVIVSGGGVSQSDALAEVTALAEHLSAPVVNSYLHNDTFPADHELACGPIGYCGSKAAMRTLAKADLVIALGTRLGPFGTLPQYDITYWPENAKLIQCDTNVAVLGVAKKADVYSCGDVKEFTGLLLGRVKELPRPGPQPGAHRRRGPGKGGMGPGAGRVELFQPVGAHASAALPRRVDQGAAQERHRGHGHRQQLLDHQRLPEVQWRAPAHQRPELGQLRLCLRRGHGGQDGQPRGAGGGLPR